MIVTAAGRHPRRAKARDRRIQAYPVAHNQAGEMPMPGTAGMFG